MNLKKNRRYFLVTRSVKMCRYEKWIFLSQTSISLSFHFICHFFGHSYATYCYHVVVEVTVLSEALVSTFVVEFQKGFRRSKFLVFKFEDVSAKRIFR